MELYWYIIMIVFIISKIFFYVCWYRSTQNQLAVYLRAPRNAQIVIVGGRAYLQQLCERRSVGLTIDGASSSLPAASSFSDVPPPYDLVSREDELKPPSYSECTGVTVPENQAGAADCGNVTDAPPPYTPSPPRHALPVTAPDPDHQSSS